MCLSPDNVILECEYAEGNYANDVLPYYDEKGNTWLFNLKSQQALLIERQIGRNDVYTIKRIRWRGYHENSRATYPCLCTGISRAVL